MQWVYESHVAEKILTDMLHRAGVTVVRSRLLAETADAVELADRRIVALEAVRVGSFDIDAAIQQLKN